MQCLLNEYERIQVCENADELKRSLSIFSYNLVKKGKKKYSTEYIDITATFDIETTVTFDGSDGFAYTFQGCINGVNFLVRYVEDFMEILDMLAEEFELDSRRRLIIYVHNLGYEHFFLTQILRDYYGKPAILLTKPKKPLSIRYEGIEFRDSLKLFQKSLEKATKGCPHAKLAGDLNYSLYRTPDSELSNMEMLYCIYDVLGLYEAIERLKKEHGYNAATIPLTNTGMVLDAVNKAIEGDGKTFTAFRDLCLNKHQLELAYKSGAGGDTHGTRWRAGQVIDGANSVDFKSAHPSQQILWKFPSGKPMDLDPNTEEKVLRSLIENEYGWLGKVLIVDFTIKPECCDPTLSLSKCDETEGLRGLDNGRVLGADAVTAYMDSNDFQRFTSAYKYTDIVLLDGFMFKLDYLPDAFRGAILDFFRVKEGAEPGTERNFAKICVNTIFGACMQKVIRDEYELTTSELLDVEHLSWEDNLANKGEEAVRNAQLKKFPFLWGLWTSSMTRLKLFELMRDYIGWENAIYWDTDSCKYAGAKIAKVSEYNDAIKRQCEDRGAVVVNRKGKKVYIGSAEDEHETVDFGYRKFTFLHAKCYAVESWNEKEKKYIIETTISGVRKKNGAAALNGNIANLKDGLYIADAGGLALTYHDLPSRKRYDFNRPTYTASYIEMTPRTYVLNWNSTVLDDVDYEILA